MKIGMPKTPKLLDLPFFNLLLKEMVFCAEKLFKTKLHTFSRIYSKTKVVGDSSLGTSQALEIFRYTLNSWHDS